MVTTKVEHASSILQFDQAHYYTWSPLVSSQFKRPMVKVKVKAHGQADEKFYTMRKW